MDSFKWISHLIELRAYHRAKLLEKFSIMMETNSKLYAINMHLLMLVRFKKRKANAILCDAKIN